MQQVDSFFTKGVSHKVCEDYTMHGDIDGAPYVIVCDGCSGSKDTDFGARLLARAAKQALEVMHRGKYFDAVEHPHEKIEMFESETAQNLTSMIKATHSHISVADATLMIAFQYGDSIYVYIRGDGSYVHKSSSTGELTVVDIEFESGAPYYLTYDLNSLNDRMYANQFGLAKYWHHRVLSDTGDQLDPIEFPNSDNKLNLTYDALTWCQFPVNETEFITIMSDGVSAFQYSNKYVGEKNPNIISSTNIIKEMNSFKNHQGEFVQRRMNRAMRTFDKRGLENFDDVSIATIWFKED